MSKLLREDGTKLLQEDATFLLLDVIVVLVPLSDVLQRSHTPVVRALFLDGDLASVIHEVPMKVISGTVGMDRKREVMRQGTVTLENADGTYTPVDPTSLVWPGRIVRIERGALNAGEPQYAQLITGLLSAPAMSYGTSSITFTVWSRLRLLDRQFSAPVSFDAGTPIDAVVRAICVAGGLGAADNLYDLDTANSALVAVRSFDVSDNMLHALTQLCFDYGLDGPYDDGSGKVVLRPFPDPSLTDAAWVFAPGQFSVLTDVAWSIEERGPVVYNRQDVVGIAPDRYPIRGSARDLNPASPTYNPVDGSGPLGDLPAPPYVSADVHTETAAASVAQQLLYEHALADLPINAQAVPIPLLSPRDVVRFAAGDLDVAARLDSLTIPLGPGEMTLVAQGVRSLLAP